MLRAICSGVMIVVFLSGGLATATPHLMPEPAGLTYDMFLEAESATSRSPIWNSISAWGIELVYRAPAADGWFQFEGLCLPTGDYNAYVSWTRPGSGWLRGDIWAGPDAANLRPVLAEYNTVGLSSYVFEWDPIGAVNAVADAIPLLATDTVVKIWAKSTAVELYIDGFMLTTDAVPAPATMVLVGLGVLGFVRRRKR